MPLADLSPLFPISKNAIPIRNDRVCPAVLLQATPNLLLLLKRHLVGILLIRLQKPKILNKCQISFRNLNRCLLLGQKGTRLEGGAFEEKRCCYNLTTIVKY
jgi:hypothetical protein